MKYPKLALTFADQLAQLEARGLVIDDKPRALRWLQRVSYFRLSAYFLPFAKNDVFESGTQFDQISDLYIFDRKLRLLLLEAIERIEVALRTAITYEIAHAYGPFGHADARNFASWFDHRKFMDELTVEERRAKETFVHHFRTKYTAEPHLPVWMATELLSFGTISQLYQVLAPAIKQRIAAEYAIQDVILSSWLHSLSYIRNVCAHHKRLWNRELAIKPKFPHRFVPVPANDRLYGILVLIQHMLGTVSPNCEWKLRLAGLISEHPDIPLAAMKFPQGWQANPPWR